jgi:peptidoglycan-associated lipoprotein
MSDADKAFATGEYYEAAGMYRKIYRKTPPQNRPLRAEVAYKMAEAYRILNMPERANAGYANGLRYAPDSLMSLQYARSLHKTRNYKAAIEQYENFLKYYPDNQFARNGLEGCRLAQQWRENPTRYSVKRMDILNSSRGEFSPIYGGTDFNVIYFSSSRKEAKGENQSKITGQKNNDFFVSRKDENGNWLKPEKIDSKINTDYDEGAGSTTASGDRMYYTFCAADSMKSSTAAIYVSQRADGGWGEGKRLVVTRDSSTMAAHPAISPSGEYLYFVSDMPGGQGGKDLWRARMVGNEADYVENLGPEINTAGDEMFPFVRNDSTIYFSSDGHPGMGGLDIFKAVYHSHTSKWKITNMKSPINSQGDDFGIAFEGNKETGFFSSNRNDARGWDHLYWFQYPVVKVALEGYIVDKDDEFIRKAIINIVGNDGTNVKVPGRTDGTYRLQLERGIDYVLMAQAEGYLNTKMVLKTEDLEKDSLYYVDFVLAAINKPVILENIFYDFGKATLRSESQKELNGLVDLLNLNPNVTIELSAHTDRIGTDEYNNKLSFQRAESVVNYLISRGIAKDRLQTAGYGKTQPKEVTKAIANVHPFLKEGDILSEQFILALPKEQQEICDQINRRTQFKVLSVNYGLQ